MRRITGMEKHSVEHKQKNRDAHIGKKQSEKTIQKKREATLGEKHPSSKRVYQYDLDGAFINSFGSGEEAGRHLNKASSNIKKCARGSRKHKTAYGFKWSYTMDIFM